MAASSLNVAAAVTPTPSKQPRVRVCEKGNKVTVEVTAQPAAVAPEGAGAADEPWEAPEPESEPDY